MTTKTSRRVGRPRKPVSEEQIERLAQIGATYDEIAFVIGIDRATVIRQYATAFEKGRAMLRMAIRRAQLKKALEDNDTAMLIWVGKVFCGQSDKLQLGISNDADPSKLSDEEIENRIRELVNTARARQTRAAIAGGTDKSIPS